MRVRFDSKGKLTLNDGTVLEGHFEEDKMTEAPTFNRTSKLSAHLAQFALRMPSGWWSSLL